MATRGTYGFYHEGKDLLSYNHNDSHPDRLGAGIGKFLYSWFEKGLTASNLAHDVSRLIAAREIPPTPLSVELARRLSETGCRVVRHEPGVQAYGGNNRYPGEVNWYHTLRDQQGDLGLTLSRGVLLVDNDFILDSLFCEWGYIVNLDGGLIEFYKGGVRLEEPCEGRYADHRPTQPGEIAFRACTILKSWPLTPTGRAQFLEAMLTWDGDKG